MPEDATVAFDTGNAIAQEVVAPGGDSGTFSLLVHVKELVPDLAALNADEPGNIARAAVTMSLVPVGPGGSISGTCSRDVTDVTGSSYHDVLHVTCTFGNVPVNTYTAEVTVNVNGYYAGHGEDVIVVFDRSLGFTTGGGWFYWPGTSDRTRFGYNMKYKRRGTQPQGSLLVIRHLPDGTIYRLKSNAILGLSLGDVGGSDPFGWASFTGKATYIEPGWAEAIGNLEYVCYVEDRNEPGRGVDRFWIRVLDQNGHVVDLSMSEPATANSVAIDGGNIVVPHRNASTK